MPELRGYTERKEMTLRDYAMVIGKRKWFVIMPAVIITVIAVVFALLRDDQYRASTDVLVQQTASSTTTNDLGSTASTRMINNELERARGSAMQNLVEEVIGIEPQLTVKLGQAKDIDVLVFSATSADAAFAAQAADTYANTYVNSRREAVIADLTTRSAIVQDRLNAISAELDLTASQPPNTLLTQQNQYQFELESLRVSISLATTSGTAVIDAAEVPEAPFSPKPIRTGILALLVGIFIGVIAAFLVEYLDNSLSDEEGLSKASGLPVLAVIPKLDGWSEGDHPRVITLESPLAPSTEAYRRLRTSLQFLGIDRSLDILQVTSPKPGDGKTTTAVNLAVAHANAGQKVVLVDCDLRKPKVHTFFDLPNDRGVTTALLDRTTEVSMHLIADVPNLRIITAGAIPPNPSELLGGTRAASFFQALSENFDLVVLDSPPVLVVSDPLVVSKHADGVVLVASAQATDTRQVHQAIALLAQVEAPMLGAVLNAFDTDKNTSYEYRYAYGIYES